MLRGLHFRYKGKVNRDVEIGRAESIEEAHAPDCGWRTRQVWVALDDR